MLYDNRIFAYHGDPRSLLKSPSDMSQRSLLPNPFEDIKTLGEFVMKKTGKNCRRIAGIAGELKNATCVHRSKMR